MDDRLLVDFKALKALGYPLSKTHTMRLIKAGRFPKPIKFSEHRNGRLAWYWKDIKEFLEACSADRTQ